MIERHPCTLLIVGQFIAAQMVAAQSPILAVQSNIALVSIAPPATPDAWLCANYSRDEWHVSLTPAGDHAFIRPAARNDIGATILGVPGGELVGQNHGEFGGNLVFRDSSSGKKIQLLQDNPVELLRQDDYVIMVAGLAHLSIRRGHLVAIRLNPDYTASTDEILNLGNAPSAVTRVGPDSLLIATPAGVLAVSIRERATKPLYSNANWYMVEPNSIVRSSAGVIYVGMRRAIAVLTPVESGFHETWLVAGTCPRQVRSDSISSCSCVH